MSSIATCPCGETLTLPSDATEADWEAQDQFDTEHQGCIPAGARVYITRGIHREFAPRAYANGGGVWFTPDEDLMLMLPPGLWRIAIRVIEAAIAEAENVEADEAAATVNAVTGDVTVQA